MIVKISSDAEADIVEGFWFYERQTLGLGNYFRDCIVADIDSLATVGGVHETFCTILCVATNECFPNASLSSSITSELGRTSRS